MVDYPNGIPDLPSSLPAFKSDPPTESTNWLRVFQNIRALATELGVNPRGSYASVKARLDAIASGAGITGLPYEKLTTTTDRFYFDQHINSTGHITADGNVVADDYLRAGQAGHNPLFKIQRYGGTLDGTGTAIVAHNVGAAHLRVLDVQGWHKGGAGEAHRMTGAHTVDGVNIVFRGGAGGVPFRGYMLFTSDSVAW